MVTIDAPALYPCTVTHTRFERARRTFRYRIHLWLVDVDELPVLPRLARPLARFRTRDHAGDPDRSIRANLEAWLEAQGVQLGGGKVYLLTAAAVFGYVFNPISVYWCHDADGVPVCVVAEVHNTYGGRHRYLLRPDESDRAEVDKQFYVSPFFTVDGRYEMSVPPPGKRLRIAVRLDRPDTTGGTAEHTAFSAGLVGRRRAATTGRLVLLVARQIWPTFRVAALIRYQGIKLWLRGLPVTPRPEEKAETR